MHCEDGLYADDGKYDTTDEWRYRAVQTWFKNSVEVCSQYGFDSSIERNRYDEITEEEKIEMGK